MTIDAATSEPGAPAVIERENPARPDEIVGSVPISDAGATSAAVDDAHAAFTDWAGRSAQERADLLREAAEDIRSHADELGLLLAGELGKPLADSEGEARFAALYLDRAINDAALAQQEDVIDNAFGRSIITRFAASSPPVKAILRMAG
jgi:acyl-CoA reductase-like NAD-dependent aldehyde dehydrogenase